MKMHVCFKILLYYYVLCVASFIVSKLSSDNILIIGSNMYCFKHEFRLANA